MVTGDASEELHVIDPPGGRVSVGHKISPARAASVTLTFTNVVVPLLDTCTGTVESGGGGMV